MVRSRRAMLFERMRSRRGAVASVLVLLALGGAVLLPVVSHLGGLPAVNAVGYAHLVRSSAQYGHVRLTDTSPGFVFDNDAVVSAAVPLDLVLYNNGTQPHSFTVYNNSSAVLPTTLSPTALNTTVVNHTWVDAWLPAGTNLTIALNFSQAGTYEVLSLVPYQFQAGLYTFLHVLPPGAATRQYLFVNATASLTFVPSTLVAAPNTPIVFVVGAQGGGHTFTVDGCSNDSAISPGTPLPTSDTCLSNAPVDLQIVNQGSTYTSAPTIIPKAGIYWYVCTIPGHFQAGMWGKLYLGIGQTPASNVPSVQTVIQYGYLALGAIVIGGAAFLVFMGQSERASLTPRSHEH